MAYRETCSSINSRRSSGRENNQRNTQRNNRKNQRDEDSETGEYQLRQERDYQKDSNEKVEVLGCLANRTSVFHHDDSDRESENDDDEDSLYSVNYKTLHGYQ